MASLKEKLVNLWDTALTIGLLGIFFVVLGILRLSEFFYDNSADDWGD